jgi:hypothetical protein
MGTCVCNLCLDTCVRAWVCRTVQIPVYACECCRCMLCVLSSKNHLPLQSMHLRTKNKHTRLTAPYYQRTHTHNNTRAHIMLPVSLLCRWALKSHSPENATNPPNSWWTTSSSRSISTVMIGSRWMSTNMVRAPIRTSCKVFNCGTSDRQIKRAQNHGTTPAHTLAPVKKKLYKTKQKQTNKAQQVCVCVCVCVRVCVWKQCVCVRCVETRKKASGRVFAGRVRRGRPCACCSGCAPCGRTESP